MDRRMIKNEVKAALKGKWIYLFVILAVMGAISSVVLGLLFPVLMFGFYVISLDVLNGQDIDVNKFIEPFKDLNQALKLLAVSLLVGLLVGIGFALFIIPGIILMMMWSQASFIMMENPELGILDAMKKSSEMMKGYKMDLFIFHLSFIGHYLLTMITFGLWMLYFLPLLEVSKVNYYKHLKMARAHDVVEVEVIN